MMSPKLFEAMVAHPSIMAAYAFAEGAHGAVGQVRKYTGDPYIVHPLEVAGIVLEYVEEATVDMIVAALLHDVLEDTGVRVTTLRRLFGETATGYVVGLTDMYTPKMYPDLNRSERKRKEAERYGKQSPAVKTIKLADGLSNTPSIAHYDPKFLKTYGPEKRVLTSHLVGGNAVLHRMLDVQLHTLGFPG